MERYDEGVVVADPQDHVYVYHYHHPLLCLVTPHYHAFHGVGVLGVVDHSDAGLLVPQPGYTHIYTIGEADNNSINSVKSLTWS